jgi:DNA helicase-2/ATP-dependent DNA helicase PcrA
MERLYKADKLEGAERLENLREIVSLAARYDQYPLGEGLEKFLESAALASEQDELKEEANAVRLMTVHASKGLEFPYVFVVGLEEGLFPYEREDEDTGDKEEERRLMYVALTRAKRRVFLSYASYRTIFGSKNATLPSQFLSDISEGLLELEAPDLPAGRQGAGKIIYLD